MINYQQASIMIDSQFYVEQLLKFDTFYVYTYIYIVESAYIFGLFLSHYCVGYSYPTQVTARVNNKGSYFPALSRSSRHDKNPRIERRQILQLERHV